MKSAWVFFVADRYIRRREGSSPARILSVLGILTGVLALIVIIAVMNGFQLGFIESIVEVSSYHIRIEDITGGAGRSDGGETASALASRVRSLPEVRAAVPFRELQALARGRREEPHIAVVRGLPPRALFEDRGMAEQLTFTQGSFDIDEPASIILGAELALRLGVRTGDTISLVSINGAGLLDRLANAIANNVGDGIGDANNADGAEDAEAVFTVTGVFRTGYYEYDLGWAFINTETARRFLGADDRLSLGIKLTNRWQDARVLAEIRALDAYRALAASGGAGAARPWRDYNRSFYGALRTEKLLMFILVGLIFIVVALNIFQAQRRQVLERREEIGLLRAVGASSRAARCIFIWDGLVTGLSGSTGGLVLGLLIAGNTGAFFTLLEKAVNAVIGLVNAVAGGHAGEFAVFSPAVFYIKEVPSRIIPHEVALIYLFGVVSALVASWLASARVSRTNPAEVLRYE